jgi:hypothetical protein
MQSGEQWSVIDDMRGERRSRVTLKVLLKPASAQGRNFVVIG